MSSDRHWEHLKTKWHTLRKRAPKHTRSACHSALPLLQSRVHRTSTYAGCINVSAFPPGVCFPTVFTQVVVVWRWRPYGAQSHPWHRWAAVSPRYLAHCSTSRKLRCSVCRLWSARVGHNVGQCACLHKRMYGEKKKKTPESRAQLTLSRKPRLERNVASCRGQRKTFCCDFLSVFARRDSYTTVSAGCMLASACQFGFSEVSYCLIRSWHGVLYFHTSLNIWLNMAALASAVAPWAAAESKETAGSLENKYTKRRSSVVWARIKERKCFSFVCTRSASTTAGCEAGCLSACVVVIT